MISKFLKNFFSKKEKFVALNLGNYYLKGLIVEDGIFVDYFIKEKKDLKTDLKELKQTKRGLPRNIKVAIKDPTSIIRIFPFPKMDKKKLTQALFYELKKYIPFSSEEVYFDFSILKDLSISQILILLAAIKKEVVDKILDVFLEENLNVLEVNLESVCLLNLFLTLYKDFLKENCAILDLGFGSSNLILFNKEEPSLIRELNVGAKDIFQIISNIKKLTFSDIDKWLSSLKDYNELLTISEEFFLNLCKEIKNSFDYFEVNRGETINTLYLTGGISFIKVIEKIFKEELGVKLNFLENFENLNFKFSKDILKNNFAVAIGLAL